MSSWLLNKYDTKRVILWDDTNINTYLPRAM
jgi:hypothetical protein